MAKPNIKTSSKNIYKSNMKSFYLNAIFVAFFLLSVVNNTFLNTKICSKEKTACGEYGQNPCCASLACKNKVCTQSCLSAGKQCSGGIGCCSRKCDASPKTKIKRCL
jgi:hypothetical protein